MAFDVNPWLKMTDAEILNELLRHEELSDKERDAFQDMRQRLAKSTGITLSVRQRGWLNETYEKLRPDLDQPLNLVSSGQVKIPKNLPTYDWERNRPLKPPGRK
jgi:hypothetical protein